MWISYILTHFSYKTYFFLYKKNKKNPRWRIQDGNLFQNNKIYNLLSYLCILYAYRLYIILKRWLYQYYWYFTYLSGKIIRNIEKSEYDVTVTSSLGVASQNWVWGFFVRRWSLCVNFMTLALLVPEIQRGGEVRGAPPVTDWPKKPVWIGLTDMSYRFRRV